MSAEDNRNLAQGLLARIGGGEAPEAISVTFSNAVRFEIQGDEGVLPWIGRKVGRAAVEAFVGGVRGMTEPLKFEVEEVLASETRAVILGALATRIKATGKVIESDFAIVLTISAGEITRFQMLEDSFDVSRAGRP